MADEFEACRFPPNIRYSTSLHHAPLARCHQEACEPLGARGSYAPDIAQDRDKIAHHGLENGAAVGWPTLFCGGTVLVCRLPKMASRPPQWRGGKELGAQRMDKLSRSSTAWYRSSAQTALDELASDVDGGLSADEVSRRQREYGPNELAERAAKSPWWILWEQLTATLVVVLIVAAVVSAWLGDWKDAIAILTIVVLNALLGFRQEYRAEQAMAALKKMAVPFVRVRRDGHVAEVSSHALVPGDIVLLEAGSTVPADGRLVASANLRAQEAALTGESEPVEKGRNVGV